MTLPVSTLGAHRQSRFSGQSLLNQFRLNLLCIFTVNREQRRIFHGDRLFFLQ
jgi:hypothetical protein